VKSPIGAALAILCLHNSILVKGEQEQAYNSLKNIIPSAGTYNTVCKINVAITDSPKFFRRIESHFLTTSNSSTIPTNYAL